jgi:hypothetical protein
MITVQITAQLEISDHDGFCSGEESEYTSHTKNYTISIQDTDIKLNFLGFNHYHYFYYDNNHYHHYYHNNHNHFLLHIHHYFLHY